MSGIDIDKDTLTASLATMEPRIAVAVDIVFDFLQAQAESQMRANAPWTDRTGNARAGLRAMHESSGGDHSLVLFHTMPYGVWLEVRHDGRYAIIGPTQRIIADQMGPMLAAAIRRAMEGSR